MKRLPLLASFLLFIALCASIAYWALQLFKPPLRPVAAPPRAMQAEVHPEAATVLFGGRGKIAEASNYQLRGVIFAGTARNSIAILSANGKPAQAVRVDMEVVPGVTVKEVHREYVLLSEGGVTKRVDLPESAKGQGGVMTASTLASPVPPAPAQNTPPVAAGQGLPSRTPPTVPPLSANPPAAAAMPPAQAPSPVTAVPPVPGQVSPPTVMTAPPAVVVSPPPAVQYAAPATVTPPAMIPQTSAPATSVIPSTLPADPAVAPLQSR